MADEQNADEQNTEKSSRYARNVDGATEIATDSLEGSSKIVKSAARILKGDVGGGVAGIVEGASQIAAKAASKGTRLLTDNVVDTHRDVLQAADGVVDKVEDRRLEKSERKLDGARGSLPDRPDGAAGDDGGQVTPPAPQ
ncbi:hypothetical protein P0W64_06520 [Tsukamurella sp. 8F]|uniref:Rv1893 family protein n=1 Tax=unclassified Tsukamurella TaxID=2633480 RepID=UPI0023B95F67|nr:MULTISPECIES: hypothetical protein [unclassified Tsukamurella]MDF0530107.1 hypothetical protein [Tsukamurella sp. 8J]MDF0586425.1 hypothetical protein [Tsukamurella sp. 8F]